MSEVFSVLGVTLHALGMQEVLKKVEEAIDARGKMLIVTANTEIVMFCQKDAFFRNIVNTAELVVPDGIGVVWAGKHLGSPVKERVAGFDLAQNLLSLAADKNWKIYFLGAAPGIAEKAAQNILKKYPDLKIAGWRDGYFLPKENALLVKEINKTAPDILFAALGAPKQEKWLYEHKNALDCKILLGVGGTFDVMAGVSKRAPQIWQELGLEWLYRLCRQPSRFWRMLTIPHFMLKILFSKKH